MTTRSRTIFALSSGSGRAGVAVIRISGPAAGRALEGLAGTLPPPREARLRRVRDPNTGEVLDQALILWFPGPHSFTGEDVAELHLHGGAAVISGVLAALGRLEGLEPALPGAFTRRAFDNDKLDLTEIEGLADLINAETEAQRKQALAQLGGALGSIYSGWRQRVLEVLAYIEAVLDFPDEDDVPVRVTAEHIASLRQTADEIKTHLDDNRRGERLRGGVRVVIAGPANVGKSTLLNVLARRDAAIVSSRAGTTRDVIEVHLDLGGVPVILVDTAGLRDARDDIERKGIERSRAQARTADIILWLSDEVDFATLTANLDHGPSDSEPISVLTKADLRDENDQDTGISHVDSPPAHSISAKTGAGIDMLIETLTARAAEIGAPGHEVVLTRARHRQALEECLGYLEAATSRLTEDTQKDELAAEELRLAVRALGRITGHNDVEAVLDLVFSEFCIGK